MGDTISSSGANTMAAKLPLGRTPPLFLGPHDLERLGMSPDAIEDIVSETLRAKAARRALNVPKREVSLDGDVTLRTMVAVLPDRDLSGVKWITAHPGNVARQLPIIGGLIVVSAVSDGQTLGVVDGATITNLRTAGCAALSARRLARPESSVLSLLACGRLASSVLRAIARSFPLKQVYAYDLDPAAARRIVKEAEHLGISGVVASDAHDAVKHGGIVVSSLPISKSPRPLLSVGDLTAGTYFCALDFDAALSAASLGDADAVVTDDNEQLETMAGLGYMRGLSVRPRDLGEILTNDATVRRHENHRIVSLNMGVSVLDIALAGTTLEMARRLGVGTLLSSGGSFPPEVG